MEDSILELGSASACGTDSIHCLAIVGQIEGHQMLSSQTKTTKYEHILPLLAAGPYEQSFRLRNAYRWLPRFVCCTRNCRHNDFLDLRRALLPWSFTYLQ